MIELLVVVAIIAMLAGVSGGYYLRSRPKRLMEKTGRELLLAAQYARIAAVEKFVCAPAPFQSPRTGFGCSVMVTPNSSPMRYSSQRAMCR